MAKKVRRSNVKDGVLLPLGNGFSLVKGDHPNKVDDVDIGPNNKTGLSVNHGEILQQKGNTLRVFSAEPMLGGVSPVQLLYGGMAPDKVFAMQEQYKDIHGINDDGSKYVMGGNKENIPNVTYNKLSKKWKSVVNTVASKIGVSENEIEKYFNEGRLNPAIAAYYNVNGRVRENDSPTKEASEKRGDGINRTIYGNVLSNGQITQSGKPNLKYAIPYLEDKEIIVDGVGRVTTNALDSLAKYAKISKISLQEAFGLYGQETKGGAIPYGNVENIKKSDSDEKQKETKERNRALFNLNYAREYGWTPAEYTVRDFEYNRLGHEVDRSIPPLQHAFDYFKKGKYNPGDKNHTKDVLNKGSQMLNDSDVKKWISESEYAKDAKIKKQFGGRKRFQNGGEYIVQKGDTLWGIAKKHNISYQQLKSYNTNISNPNLIKIGQKINLSNDSLLEQPKKDIDIKEYYKKEAQLNTSNISAIQGTKHNQNYAIIDKDNKTIKVFDINNNLLYESNKINTGAANTDYNTVTYTNKNTGKLMYNEGNNSTPAGITIISSKGIYHGSPSFQRARVNGDGSMKTIKDANGNEIPDNIASSIHWEKGIDGPNRSNGCVRADTATLAELNKYLDVGSKIYTLPQQHGSAFQLRDGILNFVDTRTQDERNADEEYRKGTKKLSDGREVSLKYHRDINTVYNGTYKPIKIEDTKEVQDRNPNKIKSFIEGLYYDVDFSSPNHFGVVNRSFQNIKSENRKQYAESLANNKEAIMKAIPALSNKEYNNLLQMALGLPERETHYNTDIKQTVINTLSDKMLSLAKRIKRNKDSVRGIGYGKVKSKSDNNELQEIYKKLNIKYTDKNINGEDSAKMVMAKLAYTYLSEIKGKHFIDSNGNTLDDMQALYYAYTGNKKNKIKDNLYRYDNEWVKNNYNDVMNYGNDFKITQQFKLGGQININSLGERPNAKYRKQMKNKRNKAVNGRQQFSINGLPAFDFTPQNTFGDYSLNKPFYPTYVDGPLIGLRVPQKTLNTPAFPTNFTPKSTVGQIDPFMETKPSFGTSTTGTQKTNPIEGSTKGSGLSTTAISAIGAGINTLGSLIGAGIQQGAINGLEAPQRQYTLLNPVKLKTKININPQITRMREMQAQLADAARRTSGSSRTAYQKMLAGHNRLLDSAMDLYGRKENAETELINRDRLNQQQVAHTNATNVMNTVNYNNEAATEMRNRKRVATSNNWTTALNTTAGAWAGPNGFIDRANALRVKAGELYTQAIANPTAARLLYGDIDFTTGANKRKAFNTIYDFLNNNRFA